MNKKILKIFSFTFLSLSVVLSSAIFAKTGEKIALGYANGDKDTYYKNISSSLEGDDLLQALRSLNDTKLRSEVGYNSMLNNFRYTDYDPSNTSKLIAFYSGTSTTKTNVNREHVWPDSHGGNLIEDDIHMVRPSIDSENRSRGNSFFVEDMNTQYDGWDPANCGDITYRGDAARIIFYSAMREAKFSLLDVNKHHTTSEENDNMMGKLSDLLKWNLLYGVKTREKNRNEGAESLQGNRNPFIDHPEYACKIWGNYNSATKQICETHGGNSEVDLEGVSLDFSSLNLEIGTETYLTATINPSNATGVSLSWISSNSRVASISYDGKVVAKNEGNTTITVTASNGTKSYTSSCNISVKGTNNVVTSPSGCGGNVVTTSSTLFSLSIIGLGILLIKRKARD